MEKYVDINHKTVIEWYANLRVERAKFLMEVKMTTAAARISGSTKWRGKENGKLFSTV